MKTRAFVDDEVLPVIGGCWERAEFQRDLAKRMGEGVEEVHSRALHMIAGAFVDRALYLVVQATVVVAVGSRPDHSPVGII